MKEKYSLEELEKRYKELCDLEQEQQLSEYLEWLKDWYFEKIEELKNKKEEKK